MNKPLNKILTIAGLTAMITLSPLASADHSDRRPDRHRVSEYGRVIDVKPVYRKVAYQKPVRECWIEPARRPHRDSHRRNHLDPQRNRSHRGHSNNLRVESVVGGVIGGVIGNHIGNQIGRHTGDRHARTGGTIAGAIVGSVIGHEAQRKHNRGDRHYTHRPQRERCHTVSQTHYREELRYYKVIYRWNGQRHYTTMRSQPGRKIHLASLENPPRGYRRAYYRDGHRDHRHNHGNFGDHSHRNSRKKHRVTSGHRH